ncbi:MAG TPA: hypothetical protein VFQ77_05150 [Pseudonocardiaceae bacterium]|jgi:hypothetical protein|nr:hypothetical protein [Pseudonocardiaceae bacterium]
MPVPRAPASTTDNSDRVVQLAQRAEQTGIQREVSTPVPSAYAGLESFLTLLPLIQL